MYDIKTKEEKTVGRNNCGCEKHSLKKLLVQKTGCKTAIARKKTVGAKKSQFSNDHSHAFKVHKKNF